MDTENRLFEANVFYREHALAYPNHSFRTCDCPRYLTSTAFFLLFLLSSETGMQDPEISFFTP